MLIALPLVAGLAAPTPTVPVVVPGHSLGGIALGTTEAELKQLGLPVAPAAYAEGRTVGPFEVQLEGGKVVRITLNLTPELNTLKVGEHTLTPRTPEDMARVLGTCGPNEARIGGNIIECTTGAVAGQHMGGLMVSVVPAAQASDLPVCTGYLVPGEDSARMVVEPGGTYCVGHRVVTTATVQADVLGKLGFNTCQVQPNEGATLITCPYQGVRLIFASPTGALARVEGVTLKQ